MAGLFGGLVDSAVTAAVNAIANAGLDSITSLEYTQDGSLARSTDALANVTTYQYNAFAEQSHVNNAGRAGATSYDRKGQATQQNVDPNALNITTKYEYDFQGRKTRVIEAFGTAAERTTQYDYYDAQQRMQERVDPNGLNMRTQFSYDRDGNVLNKTRFSNGATSENRVTRYVYDNENRLRFAIDGEGGITETLVLRIYQTAFRFFDLAYGATLGVSGFVIVLGLTLLFVYAQQRQDRARRS